MSMLTITLKYNCIRDVYLAELLNGVINTDNTMIVLSGKVSEPHWVSCLFLECYQNEPKTRTSKVDGTLQALVHKSNVNLVTVLSTDFRVISLILK